MPFSLLQPLSSIPIACLDLETTGASADYGERIIEVGIVRYENGRKVAQYEQLIDPRRRISAGVTALTGITQSMCENQPAFAAQLDRMMPLLHGAALLGHNIRFDLSFLLRECGAAGIDLPQTLGNIPVFDTVRIARRRFGRGGNGLGTLSRRLGYEPPIAHRALPDAVTTAIVFERLLEPVGGWPICLCDCLREQGGPMSLEPPTKRQSILPLELEEALDRGAAVLMEYVDANQLRTRRLIEPIQIRRVGDELVLIAHCRLRNDRRTFKVERIARFFRPDEVDEIPPDDSVPNNEISATE